MTATIAPRAGTPATRTERSPLRRCFDVVIRPSSYRNIAYLLLGLPLGTAWFTILTTGIAVGLSTVIIALIGLPLLLAVWYLTRALANVERGVANLLLGQQLALAPLAPPRGDRWRTRIGAMVADRRRWRELVYLLLRFPLGTATAVFAATALATPIAVAWAPITARVGHHQPFGDWALSDTVDVAASSPWAWLLVPVGAALFVAALHLVNAAAHACARLNTAWLDARVDADAGGARTGPEPGHASRRGRTTVRSAPAAVTDVAAYGCQLTKVHGAGDTAVTALDSVDVAFDHGRLTAIMGPSGSGKSTLLHLMAGLDTPTAGRVVIGDIDLSALDDDALTRLRRERIGFVFQAFNLVPQLTAAENITLPLSLAGKEVDRRWYDEVVDTLGLRERLQHKPAEMSGGQQQRVAIGRAITSRPAVIFADEPTGNLDSRASAEVLRFLRASVDQMGQTVVMVTHDAVAASQADRVLFLADGRIVDEVTAPTADRVLDRLKALEI